jgi:Mce-associated membrane protein
MKTQESTVLESDRTEAESVDRDIEESPTETAVVETASADPDGEGKPTGERPARRRISLSVRGLAVASVIVALVVAVGVMTWFYLGAQRKLDEQARQAEGNTHAEKIALDYAVNAAAMNFKDLDAWKTQLVAGTSPELKDKLSKAGTSMEQILVPLQWNSTSSPLAAKVVSQIGGTYVVDSFVSVLTQTLQNPDPLRSTATYSVTIDSNNGWQISDVGGVGAVVGQK